MQAPQRAVTAPPSFGVQLARYAGLLALSAVPLALLWSNPYWVNVLAYTYLFAALAAAWNIIGGFGGQFSLGHGVFFAIGAYSVARLYLDLGLTPWIAIFPAARARDHCRAAHLVANVPPAWSVLRHRHYGHQRSLFRACEL